MVIVSESLYKFFKSTVNSLIISENNYLLADTRELIDPVEIALKINKLKLKVILVCLI